ncbi:MAG: ABC transporter permease [Sphingobacteriaceae bacterium]|nr:ABC transporter permease [Sphingobacteriaceae bacterium]
MGKIGLIIHREVMAKLRSKTFIIMTFLAPVLIAGFFGVIIWMSMNDKAEQNILVIDETEFFKGKLSGNDYITFSFTSANLDKSLDGFYESDKTCLLYIPNNLVEGAGGAVKIFYKKAPGFAIQTDIRNQVEKILYEHKLRANNIDPQIIHNAKQSVKLITEKVNEKGEHAEQTTGFMSIFGFLSGAIMFMFILLYGMMVFRSVMEEKTNRIVEIIVSSVKPFQLMLGKIIGIAILGIGQFITMGIITAILSTVLSTSLLGDINKDLDKFQKQQDLVYKNGTNVDLEKFDKMQDKLEVFEIIQQAGKINYVEIAICFLLYFLGGYLFYSSILAAIGSAVDAEADAQQFMMPVMLPLIAGYFISAKMMTNPEGSMAFWGSIIPFTSPIVMMARLPFGVPVYQIIISIALLFASFVGTTWLAGKIYRTGILMYGKKVTWRELSKWLFYK